MKIKVILDFTLKILVGVLLTMLGGLFVYNFFFQQKVTNRAIPTKTTNQVISEFIKAGNEKKVFEFYDKLIGNRSITYMIVSTAILNDIPVNYFVALAFTESGFNLNAVGKNIDAFGNVWSYDYGLYQLNSDTFKEYDKSYLMIPENNIRFAADYLKDKYKKYRNWYETIISYNAGGTELVKNRTIKHLVSVLSMTDDLQGKFEMEF
jgi:hypothetical protein